MTDPLRIANCSGFYGDRLSAATEMVDDGDIHVLTGDWLAELTMLILARTRAKHPGGGYARSFVTQMEQVLGTCLERGIKVVANAGGLDPGPCADAVAEVARALGLSPAIAFVHGDDLLGRLVGSSVDGVDIVALDSGAPIEVVDPISANAYLGGWGIAAALDRGADVVITGRTTDAAIVCGPAAWHHGWAPDDLDQLAGAVVAGHVIECGTQATGGNYSFFTEIPGLERAGFPWAEIASDGSSVIGKHDGTGGAVTVGTVVSQLLYEIGSPEYLGPDVTARFDTIDIEQIGPDRVALSGAKGAAPPDTLKVSMTSIGGYRSDASIALTGLDIEAKADLVERAFWRACPVPIDEFDDVTTTIVRTDQPDPVTAEQAVASWRVTVKDRDRAKVAAIAPALNEVALSTIPGLFGLPSAGVAKPFGIHTSGRIPRRLVEQRVTMLDGPTFAVAVEVPSGARSDQDGSEADDASAAAAPPGDAPPWSRTTRRVPIGQVIGARSGDKGGIANLGVFTRTAAEFAWVEEFLSIERLRLLLPETATHRIERFALPNLLAVNFVVHGLLQDGVASSTRQDGQAKALGEWLRARHVEVPESLLEEVVE